MCVCGGSGGGIGLSFAIILHNPGEFVECTIQTEKLSQPTDSEEP